jgi:hypothetical protein
MYFLGGIQLLSLGIIGEYMSKIYLESKRRPRYVIEKVVGAEGAPAGALDSRHAVAQGRT